MCRELKELGVEPVVSIWPTINPHSENYHEMSEANLLVRTENGQYGTFDFYGQQTFIDVTHLHHGIPLIAMESPVFTLMRSASKVDMISPFPADFYRRDPSENRPVCLG